MSRPLAFVHTASCFHLSTLADPAVQAYDVADVYLPEYEGDFSEFGGIYLASRCHPEVLAGKRPALQAALQRPGARLYIDGVSDVQSWLPGVGEILRGCNFWAWRTGEDVGRRSVNTDHPIWREYLTEQAAHWHYHGVLAPPAGATPLLVLTEDHDGTGPGVDPMGGNYRAVPGHPNVLLYHDAASYPAEVIVTTLDASFHHGLGFMPGATQLMLRMLAWLGGPR